MAKQERSRLARFFAPGVGKVKEFSVQMVMESKDSFKVDWDSFEQSDQVREQMEAATGSQNLRFKHD